VGCGCAGGTTAAVVVLDARTMKINPHINRPAPKPPKKIPAMSSSVSLTTGEEDEDDGAGLDRENAAAMTCAAV